MIKETLVLSALAVSSPAVVDGDTVKIAGIRIRLTDFDAPELFSPKCPAEYARAQAAKLELQRLIGQIKLELVPCAYYNYGRLCAKATVNGEPLSEHMIKAELAAPYVCRPGWCPQKIDWCGPADRTAKPSSALLMDPQGPSNGYPPLGKSTAPMFAGKHP
jgi:hypothetical protein